MLILRKYLIRISLRNIKKNKNINLLPLKAFINIIIIMIKTTVIEAGVVPIVPSKLS
jgi:hypothetical protein